MRLLRFLRLTIAWMALLALLAVRGAVLFAHDGFLCLGDSYRTVRRRGSRWAWTGTAAVLLALALVALPMLACWGDHSSTTGPDIIIPITIITGPAPGSNPTPDNPCALTPNAVTVSGPGGATSSTVSVGGTVNLQVGATASAGAVIDPKCFGAVTWAPSPSNVCSGASNTSSDTITGVAAGQCPVIATVLSVKSQPYQVTVQ
jgi:hypothetical protein